jgi:hypothetical protein
MDSIFNSAFFVAIFALIISRLVYVISFPKPIFYNFLGFILFPYFPGLSLVGAVIGGIAVLILYSLYKKNPLGRVIDFFAISLLPALSLGFAGSYFLAGRNLVSVFQLVFYIIFLLICLKIFYPLSSKGKIKDGGIGLIFLIVFSTITFMINLFLTHFSFSFSIENLLLLLLLIISLAVFIFRQLVTTPNK